MGEISIRLPDIGEGIAQAELVEWNVSVGDLVQEDQVIASVMTDKATVEIPSAQGGKVLALGCEIGEMLAVGAEMIRLESDRTSDAKPVHDKIHVEAKVEPSSSATAAKPEAGAAIGDRRAGKEASPAPSPKKAGGPVLASPSVRRMAMEKGADLSAISGTGSVGQVTHADLEAFINRPAAASGRSRDLSTKDIKVVGLRRKIAERMSEANSRIPHITYVEEVDVTALEKLRATLNARLKVGQSRLSILPFIVQAISIAIRDEPSVNAHYDDDGGTIRQFGALHAGIAIQTPSGLVVGCVPHVEAMDLFETAAAIQSVSAAAKAGTASREQLSGSTLTVSAVGPMGGLVSTPIINRPEVAIVGVTKVQVRPMWDGTAFVPRTMVNLASSFDHRVVDGWNAAVFIQAVKALLEEPALLFVGRDH